MLHMYAMVGGGGYLTGEKVIWVGVLPSLILRKQKRVERVGADEVIDYFNQFFSLQFILRWTWMQMCK